MADNSRRTDLTRPLAARRDLAAALPRPRTECWRQLPAASMIVAMVFEVLTLVVGAADRRLAPAGCHGHLHWRTAVLQVLLSMLETIRRVGRGCACGRMLCVLLLCVRSLRDAESLTCSASSQTACIPAALSVARSAGAYFPRPQ